MPAALATPASAELSAPLELLDARLGPSRAIFDGPREVSLRYRFGGDGPEDFRVRVVRAASGRTVRSWVERDRQPRALYRRSWNGTDAGGRVAPNGRYRFHLEPLGWPGRWRLGSVALRDHVHPVDGPHSSRGPIGEFGAPRSGGRRHEGYDLLADCGTPLIAARGGRVKRVGFDPVLYGWFVLIDGRKTTRDYFYSHLRRRPKLRRGERIHSGERVGEVGKTGNARTTPCHLHFELRGRSGPIDPKPELRRWDRWS